MLKALRVTLAVLSILAVTLLFVNFTGTAARLWPWMAQVQLMPAILSANVAAIACVIGATLLFGRVYCSVVCPLGIFQDAVNWLRGRVGKKKSRVNRFKWSPAWTKTRLAVLTAFATLLILGLFNILWASIAGLIEPYSAYGRIASQIFAPAVDGINNMLARWSESRVDNYDFYRVAVVVSAPVLAIAIATLVAIVITAWRGGRDYCNTVCPVGTMLGYLSKLSLLKMRIDTGKCINCGKCARNCKAKCINPKAHSIDYTRCVACMDCIGHCSEGAISYTWRRKSHAQAEPHAAAAAEPASPATQADGKAGNCDAGRRGFVIATGALTGALAMHAIEKTTDGGLAPLKKKQAAKRAVPVVPAGAQGLRHISSRCTACQLCVQTCPSGILKPAVSLDGFMQPRLDFSQDFCPPYCTACGEICPAGAILPVTEEEKSSIKIGTAVVDLEACLSAAGGNRCGSCAKHCPAGAIKMTRMQDGSSRFMPVVNDEACIGCGSCEYHCPVGTLANNDRAAAAIHVEGIEAHREI